MTKKDKKHL